MEEIKVLERHEQLNNKGTSAVWLQKLLYCPNCTNKQIAFKGIKILVFIALLISVILLYGLDIYSKFQNQAKTFTTMPHDFDDFKFPPTTICMGNALKPTVMKKYGVLNIFDFTAGSEAIINMSSICAVQFYV